MYNLKLTEEQAQILAASLDLFTRVGCGDFEEMLRHPTWQLKTLMSLTPNTRRDLESNLDRVRLAIADLRHSERIGIPAADEINKIAYDVLQVIRHKLAWDKNPDGGMQVKFQEPMKLCFVKEVVKDLGKN